MECLRVLTLNLWGDHAPLVKRLDIAVRGLRTLAPDVITLQEVHQSPAGENTARTIAETLGMKCTFAPACPSGSGVQGLAILSRAAVVRSETHLLPHAEKEQRICLGVVLATDAGELPVFTTHLAWRVSEGVEREDQVVALDDFVTAFSGKDHAVRIVTGDFNATPAHDELRFLVGQHTLAGRRPSWVDAWERAGEGGDGLTWSSRNPAIELLRFCEPDRRIDYVLVTTPTRDGRGTVESCRVALDEPDADGVFASDHFAVMADVRLAPMD